MTEIAIRIWFDETVRDWSAEINDMSYSHCSTETMIGLVELAIVEAEQETQNKEQLQTTPKNLVKAPLHLQMSLRVVFTGQF